MRAEPGDMTPTRFERILAPESLHARVARTLGRQVI
jgi:hypothetical protein